MPKGPVDSSVLHVNRNLRVSSYTTKSILVQPYMMVQSNAILAVHTVMNDSSSRFLSAAQLVKLKIKAMRAGVWFRALPRIDRVLVDLTIKVAENIHSVSLAKSILTVVGKLEGLLESKVLKSLRLVGRPLAKKTSLTAQNWGNVSAKNWATDFSFAFFLAVIHTNG